VASEPPDGQNPYAPPASDVNAGIPGATGEWRPAERGTRLVARATDGLLLCLALLPALLASLQRGALREGSSMAVVRAFASGELGLASGAAFLGLALVQAYLVATTGQSIAKRLFKLKIVKVDGAPVGFVSGVLLRHWLVLLLLQIPDANLVLFLADALFIFRKDRRCLHDLVAGTRVIERVDASRARTG
jgi:uncharacterized RDD family membrane protein YckC